MVMKEYPYLQAVKSPEGLKALSPEELPALCEEIRAFLVDKVSKRGGHLASNLGAVESTVALFSTFNFPKDKIIFDVGQLIFFFIFSDRFSERFKFPYGI